MMEIKQWKKYINIPNELKTWKRGFYWPASKNLYAYIYIPKEHWVLDVCTLFQEKARKNDNIYVCIVLSYVVM